MGESKEQQTEDHSKMAALEAENKQLKLQIIQIQRAFLMQQRELNVLQMEKLDASAALLYPYDPSGRHI